MHGVKSEQNGQKLEHPLNSSLEKKLENIIPYQNDHFHLNKVLISWNLQVIQTAEYRYLIGVFTGLLLNEAFTTSRLL